MQSHKSIPSVSLIIVTYNAEEFINDCLLSVYLQSYRDFETIVIDNNSKDRTIEKIRADFPWVKLIESKENLGFTGGVNTGYSFARGKYIALLNPDTRVDSKWLENLVSTINSNEEIGICASLMLNWGTDVIDTAGDGCTRAGKGFKLGHNQSKELHQISREVFAACGGAVLYRRKMLDEIGFFDQDFFLLHEDTDISFRAQLAGWKCRYVHDAVVEHRVSASIGNKTPLAVYHSVKNSDVVWLKNMPILLLALTLPEKLLSDIASLIYLGFVHGRKKEYLKAKAFVTKNLPKIINKRKEVQKKRKISNKQILQLLTPFLSIKHLKMLWKEKSSGIKYFSQNGGASDKSGNFTNNTNS